MPPQPDNNQQAVPAGPPCPRCERPMQAASVKTAIWRRKRLFVVEDIPAQVCAHCMEQFYDEAAAETLRRLTEEGFASVEPLRKMQVPVYSLAPLIPPQRETPEEELHEHY